MSVIPPSHTDLLERPLFAHLATRRADGSPQVNPMWVVWDGTHLRMTGTTVRYKHRNIEAEPRVALSINDPDQPYRYLEVRGTVVDVLDDSSGEFFLSLAARYGMKTDGPPGDVAHRVVYVVRPDHTTSQ
ncbi:PPOX class F420-dependent oxidoreductase [Antribacter gilvus]|uniref:PPOX class F420-dependent oxidoreductase n=1 Tax=Antribacter gilvus TaxID=2304675 RepID=UPI000F7AEA7A|nr:PPOX class F420-dependent oxidoreductase [Antribacter gilvus]